MGILLGARIGFKEEDSPNFQRSCYSKTQATMSTSVVLRVVMQSIFTCMVSVWVVGVGRAYCEHPLVLLTLIDQRRR